MPRARAFAKVISLLAFLLFYLCNLRNLRIGLIVHGLHSQSRKKEILRARALAKVIRLLAFLLFYLCNLRNLRIFLLLKTEGDCSLGRVCDSRKKVPFQLLGVRSLVL